MGLVILGSDKTHLSVNQGDQECHAVYLSCGNIKSSLRSKLSNDCWMAIAYIPIPKFDQVEHQGMLSAENFHQCMRRPLINLMKGSITGIPMLDPAGRLLIVRTFLSAYIADHPEQLLIACAASSSAPCSTALWKDFGTSADPYPLREGWKTLDDIRQIKEELAKTNDQNNLEKRKQLSKERHLNGVMNPFWAGWLYADPCRFLVPDILHQGWKLFSDTFGLDWGPRLIGSEEYDIRLSNVQRLVGHQHFSRGYTRFKQHPIKEAKYLASIFLGIIAGHPKVHSGFLRAARNQIDSLHLSNYRSHSDATVEYMDESDKGFHENKQHIVDAGLRNGPRQAGKFRMPKLEQGTHRKRFIKDLGSLPQFSAEPMEHLHVTEAKEPWRESNRKEAPGQMCRTLDRRAKCRLFTKLVTLHSADDGTMLTEVNPVQHERALRQLKEEHLSAPVASIFKKRTALCSDTTAFQLRRNPNKELAIADAQGLYNLPALEDDLSRFFLGPRPRRDASLPFSSISVWYRMRTQLRDPQDPDQLLRPVTILADPEYKGRTLEDEIVTVGCYNFVLVHKRHNLDPSKYFGIRGAFSLLH